MVVGGRGSGGVVLNTWQKKSKNKKSQRVCVCDTVHLVAKCTVTKKIWSQNIKRQLRDDICMQNYVYVYVYLYTHTYT